MNKPLYQGESFVLITHLKTESTSVVEKHTDYDIYIIWAVDAKTGRVLKKYSRDVKSGYDREHFTIINDEDMQLVLTSEVTKRVTAGGHLTFYSFVSEDTDTINAISSCKMGPFLDNPIKAEAV
jgi:hypothetical protein